MKRSSAIPLRIAGMRTPSLDENSLPVNRCGHVHSRMGHMGAGGGDSVEVGAVPSPGVHRSEPQPRWLGTPRSRGNWKEPMHRVLSRGRITPVSPVARCHEMPAVHRSPLPRLCQYLEHGSRPAAGAPPLQSTHRHKPRQLLQKQKSGPGKTGQVTVAAGARSVT